MTSCLRRPLFPSAKWYRHIGACIRVLYRIVLVCLPSVFDSIQIDVTRFEAKYSERYMFGLRKKRNICKLSCRQFPRTTYLHNHEHANRPSRAQDSEPSSRRKSNKTRNIPRENAIPFILICNQKHIKTSVTNRAVSPDPTTRTKNKDEQKTKYNGKTIFNYFVFTIIS